MWQFPTKCWDSRFHWSLRDPATLGLVLEWCLWTGVNSSCPCWLAFALHLTTFPTKSQTWIWMMMSRLTEEKFLALFPSTVRKQGAGLPRMMEWGCLYICSFTEATKTLAKVSKLWLASWIWYARIKWNGIFKVLKNILNIEFCI